MTKSYVRTIFLSGAVILGMLGGARAALAQQPTVHGRVVVAGTNDPVAGAAVSVQGSAAGATTNDRGEFTIQVPPDATLIVRRIGFARVQQPVGGRTTLTISLPQTAVQLNQVVTVGYGVQKRSDVTGAVVTVPQEKLHGTPNVSLIQSLEGSVPGVSVTTTRGGSEPGISTLVRGRSSITASVAPLVVVDGIPYEGPLSALNQDDVESISVLKDASATAIYGSRGSNGVLIVTTKHGKPGKPGISYSGYTGTQRISNMPHLMTGAEFAEFKCQRLKGTTCATTPSALTASEQAMLAAGQSTDWVGLASHTGKQTQNQLAISGGNDDTRYYLSGAALDVGGIAINDQFKRYTGRANFDQTLFKRITIGTNTQYSWSDRTGVSANFSDAFFMNPLTRAYDSTGALTVFPWPEDLFWANPLQGLLAKNSDVEKRLFTSNYLRVELPISGLSYRLNAGMDIGNRDVGTYYGRDTRTGSTLQGQALIRNSERNDWTVENILRYNRALGRHNVDVTLLGSTAHSNIRGDTLTATGFPNDVLSYYQTNVAALVLSQRSSLQSALVSTMARVNYNFADRYLATYTTRRDGFSGFGRNHKYGVFPSLALAWNISNESFWPLAGRLPVVKLRYSHGSSGNQAVRPYQTLSQLDDRSYLNGATTAPGYIPVTLGNPDLRWETTVARNIGADFGFGSDRVVGSIDSYTRTTHDLLLQRTISSVHGINSILQNIGKTENRGVELQLSTRNIERGSFSWRTDLSYAKNRNKIIDLYGNRTDDLVNRWFIGHPIDVNYAYKFGGIWQLTDDIKNSAQPTAKPGDVRVVDVNGDGQIGPADRTFIGNLEPRYTAGLTNTINLGRITLKGFLVSVQGVTRVNPLLGSTQVQAEVRRNITSRVYWTPTNPINTYPSNINETQGGGSNPLGVDFYENASFKRLRDLSVAFALPEKFLGRIGGQSASLYLNGRNLWTSTRWTGLDPELITQQAIPLEKTVTAGLDIKF
ncbi:MAG: TonB-dependent receptor [Gemmatimonadaceae bacterium]|nr:TonB-dependent receptor [Gemmatimonadaceae bacterium]